jgi:5'-nucleotidase
MEIERAGEVFPIEDDKIYTVATYSWTGGGGDKYYPFARKKAVESYVTDSDVLAETIRYTRGVVEKSKDGRIVVKK